MTTITEIAPDVFRISTYVSDIDLQFHQSGDVEASTTSDVIDRARKTLATYENGDFPNYMPWTTHTERILQELARLNPKTLAVMHGSTFIGDGAQAIRDLSSMMQKELVLLQ